MFWSARAGGGEKNRRNSFIEFSSRQTFSQSLCCKVITVINIVLLFECHRSGVSWINLWERDIRTSGSPLVRSCLGTFPRYSALVPSMFHAAIFH